MHRDLRLFEIRKVFFPRRNGTLPEEQKRVTAVMTGRRYPDQWNLPKDPVDFFDIKGVAENLLRECGVTSYFLVPTEENFYLHPACSGDILIDTKIGCVGKMHPDVVEAFDIDQDVYLLELDFLSLLKHGDMRKEYKAFSRYPAVQRDIALILEESVSFSQVWETVKNFADTKVTQIHLFDVYRGQPIPEGKKSMAFRITYHHHSGTLTDEEVNHIHEEYIKKLLPRLHAQLR
jgi:phenylalanyl-tRNA synthetase beta chain